ncbi:MAG: hypothetical protein HOL05_13250, partial [Nitrospinaceae bacterium]|nr:hypothetical protein [Nitrospinaceae bacterium]
MNLEMRKYKKILLSVSLMAALIGCSNLSSDGQVGHTISGDGVTLIFAAWFNEEAKLEAMRKRAKKICQNENYSLSNVKSKTFSGATWRLGPVKPSDPPVVYNQISAVVTCGSTSQKIVANRKHKETPPPNVTKKRDPIIPPKGTT